MNDLTIQENKHYYIKDSNEEVYIDFFWGEGWFDTPNEDIKEVLAEVPSYEEWQASYNCMAENEVLRLKNAKLKELLKECRRPVCWYVDIFKNKAKLLAKIIQALGEDK